MFDSRESQRRIGRCAWVLAWFGLVMGQLHAMARHQTADGKEDLDVRSGQQLVGALAARSSRPLLDWANADTVYLTYGKLWLPVFVAFTLCAIVIHRQRRPQGFEKWAWRVALTGYVAACFSVAAEYWTQWGTIDYDLLDTVFLATIPFMLLTMIGSTLLGIVLLRGGMRAARRSCSPRLCPGSS